jgi:hypothetical protein
MFVNVKTAYTIFALSKVDCLDYILHMGSKD